MRVAIATGTAPGDWGLEPDFETLATFELELQMMAAGPGRRGQVVGRG